MAKGELYILAVGKEELEDSFRLFLDEKIIHGYHLVYNAGMFSFCNSHGCCNKKN